MKKGILITILVIMTIIIFLSLLVGFIYLQFTQEPYIPNNAFLQIKIQGSLTDDDSSFGRKSLTMRDLWYQIERAKNDSRIKGIILHISHLQSGYAKAEDLGRILKDFQTTGKKVYAYIESGGLKEYLVASYADKIFLFKDGQLLLKGLAAHAVFLKDTFGKLGIQPDILHIGDYKTGANQYTENHLTPTHRESLQNILDDIYNSTLASIAKNRGMDIEVLRDIVNETPLENNIYLEKKLVDKLIYEDEIIGEEENPYKTISFRTYSQTTKPSPFQGKNKIAIIFAQGEIYSGESGKNSLTGDVVIGSDTLARQLKKVRKDSSVKAVILRVDSPGGSPLASNVIAREADLLRNEKPLIISMSDLAASGGYLISLPSSKIISLPQTITGSIGVLGGKFVLYELYEKIGIKKEVLSTSEYADIFSDYRPFNFAERRKMKKMMEITYHDFKRDVSKNRQMKLDEVETAARGRAWVGISALDLKLVDQIGGMTTAFNLAKEMADIPPSMPVGVRIYPKKKSFMEFVVELFGMKLKNPFEFNVKEKLSFLKHYFPAVIFPYRIDFD